MNRIDEIRPKASVTRHARKRAAQRGFREPDLELIHIFGTAVDEELIVFTRQDLRPFEQLVGKAIVRTPDGFIATAYRPTKRQVKRRRRLRRSHGGDGHLHQFLGGEGNLLLRRNRHDRRLERQP